MDSNKFSNFNSWINISLSKVIHDINMIYRICNINHRTNYSLLTLLIVKIKDIAYYKVCNTTEMYKTKATVT